MQAKKLKNIVIEITQGDIATATTDAIVNAANNHLYMGAGVAGALKAHGGIEIEKEAIKKGPIPIGSAIETGAGRLKARYVIHAAVMGMDFNTNEIYIRDATKNSLILSEKLKISSISFPALGTGVGEFPIPKCAEIMFDEIKKFDKTDPVHLKRVIFYLFTKKAYNDFEEVFRNFKVD
ncbi:MAG: macro domain-containing protein [Candidatus Goldbacteria bacterium]|nr:macro domain-containing protein [Candidatus Goldiibacteriota bacterium]